MRGLVLVVSGCCCAAALAADPQPKTGYDDFQKQIQPFFNKYCIQCHSADGTEPDIRFDLFTDQASLEKWSPMLEKAQTMLSSQKMPPKAEPQPTAAERNAVLTWLQAYASSVDCDDPATKNPGRVTIRRLNREEYNNTIRDLLAMPDFRPAAAFPADDAGYGFDNIGDVLSIAPVLMEKYLSAANVIMEKALFSDPVIPPPLKRWTGATMEGSFPKSNPDEVITQGNRGRSAVPGRVFNYAGEIFADYDFPADGEYMLRIRGYGRQRPMVQFKIDDQNIGRPVSITEDINNTKFYGPDKIKVTKGTHRVTVSLVNGQSKEDYEAALAKAATQPAATAPSLAEVDEDALAQAGARRGNGAAPAANADGAAADPAAAAQPPARGQRGANAARGARRGGAGARGARGGGGGPSTPVIGVVFVEVEGPLEVTPDRMPESYRRIMVAHPSATLTKSQAAEQIIRNFASKAYRRPVKDDEVKELMSLWSKFDADSESFEVSIGATLQAVLASPNFIYRYERDPGADDAGGVRTLDEYELASRLSYFLWSSMPDDELFALAAKGQLRANLDAQVKRMLADPKSQALVDNFAGQWLKLRMMNTVAPDTKTFPDFDEALRQAMITETQMFFASIMHEDRSVLDFIDADYTFLNERLAKHYGIEGVTGDEFRKVQLKSPERGGLLTQASVLTITSYPGRTSPVQRGKWVLENLFDQSPPPPPPNVPPLQDQGQLKGTLRQRMEQHRANPACATCHEQMDAIGFGLENFNAIGAWRSTEDDARIDASGSLPGGQKFNGPAELKQLIKSRQDDFCKTLTGKLLTYALGRGLEKYDQCTVDEIDRKVKAEGYKFSVLVDEIVHSDPFQKRSAKQ
jgi:hypothetical protein